MKYDNIVEGRFISRINRFVAEVEVNNNTEKCHVKNTGRCKELLIKGAKVYLQESNDLTRKTKYSLINIEKGTRLINMDSQAPNKVVKEWLEKGNLFQDITLLRPEKTYGNSRFDLYLETHSQKVFIEVKGVTLEEDGVVRFPDAPTERGIKHIKELCKCVQDGYQAYIIFVIQMKGVSHFEPNNRTHKEFGLALKEASQKGVKILALDSHVTHDTLEAADYVPVVL